MKEYLEKIKTNAIYDMKKTSINQFERAEFLTDYMKEHKLSHTQLAGILGIKKSTLTGWLKYNQLNNESYRQLLKDGHSKSEIFNALKCKKGISALTHNPLLKVLRQKRTELMLILDVDKSKITPDVNQEIQTIVNLLNRKMIKFEKELHIKRF